MHLNPSAHTIERSIAFILASHRSLRFYGCFKAEIKILFYIQKPDVSQTAILFPTTVVIFSLRCCIWTTVLCLSFSRDVQAYSGSLLLPSPQRSARRLGAENETCSQLCQVLASAGAHVGEPSARREERICPMTLLAEQRLVQVLEVSFTVLVQRGENGSAGSVQAVAFGAETWSVSVDAKWFTCNT